jgi:hypothetical protein
MISKATADASPVSFQPFRSRSDVYFRTKVKSSLCSSYVYTLFSHRSQQAAQREPEFSGLFIEKWAKWRNKPDFSRLFADFPLNNQINMNFQLQFLQRACPMLRIVNLTLLTCPHPRHF